MSAYNYFELFILLMVAWFVICLWRQATREDAEMRRLTNMFLARLDEQADRERRGNHEEL